jgi:membrane protein YqaA with SNARE-associated domain
MARLKEMYTWTLSWARSPYGLAALFVLSFVESSFFPIPPDPLLMALALGAPRRWLLIAAVCTAASVLGGLFGYFIGAFFYDQVGVPVFEWYGIADKVDEVRGSFRDQGAMAVFLAALTPIPYKLITITAGAAGMDIPAFTAWSVLGRGMRFFAVAGLIGWKGEAIAGFVENHFEKLTIAFGAAVVLGFVAFRYLV